jgi:hypothetical protein
MMERKAFVSECGRYVAVPFGEDCADYDVIETATGRVWLSRRYTPTGWSDTDRRYTHAEFPRMVTGWLNEGRQRGKRWISAFDLSFVDADMTIPIKAFTGNVVVKSYSAAFRRAVPRSHTRRLAAWRTTIAKAEAEYMEKSQ